MARRFFSVALVLVTLMHFVPPGARASGSWVSDEYGVTVRWGSEWEQIDAHQDDESHQLLLELAEDPVVHDEYVAWAFSSTNPFDILEDFISRFRSDYPDIKVTQEWNRGGSTGAFPMIIELDPSAEDPRRELLNPAALAGGNSFMEVISFPTSYQPTDLRQQHSDITVDADWVLLDYDAQGPSQPGSSPPTPTPEPTIDLSDCPELLEWADAAEDWLSTIDGAIETLEVYRNVSSYPVPGAEYGASNAYRDMAELQEQIDRTQPPASVELLQSRIGFAAGSVESAAGVIFPAVRFDPVNHVMIDSALSSLDAVRSELIELQQEVETVFASC